MKKQAEAVQYTIRGISRQVDRVLRQKARRSRRSLNQLVVDELTKIATGNVVKADFSDLVGRWETDVAFDEVIATQRQIDLEKWT